MSLCAAISVTMPSCVVYVQMEIFDAYIEDLAKQVQTGRYHCSVVDLYCRKELRRRKGVLLKRSLNKRPHPWRCRYSCVLCLSNMLVLYNVE